MVTKEFVLGRMTAGSYRWQGRAVFGISGLPVAGQQDLIVERREMEPGTNHLKPPFNESIPLAQVEEADFSLLNGNTG